LYPQVAPGKGGQWDITEGMAFNIANEIKSYG
jgi:hypothetical protein